MATSRQESAEGKAYREISGELIEFVEDPYILAWKLYSKRLISKNAREKASMKSVARAERCVYLVEALENTIDQNPKTLTDLLEVLRTEESITSICEKLSTIYADIKKKMEKANRSNGPGMTVMGTLFVQLKNTLEFHMKTVDVSNEGSNDGVTRDALKKFIKTSVKSGVKLEDLKDCLLQLHDVELLVNEQEYRWATKFTESLYAESHIPPKVPVHASVDQKQETHLFSKESVYYASLCCLTVNRCDASNYHKFLATSHPHHSITAVSLSRPRENEVDRYLIAVSGKTCYISFKSETSLTEWKRLYHSFEEGIKIQAARIPLRFFIHLLNDGYRLVFTGFSFGGLLACNVVANLCHEPYLTSDQIASNVVCITFSQPLINISSVLETAQQRPVLNSILHNVLMVKDILPKIVCFLENGLHVSGVLVEQESRMILQSSLSSLLFEKLSKVQNSNLIENVNTSSCTSDLEFAKELLFEMKSPDLSNRTLCGNVYMISAANFQWNELPNHVFNLAEHEIKEIDNNIFLKPTMIEYLSAITHGYLKDAPIYTLPQKNAYQIQEIDVLKPSITNVSFHQHGKELAVVIEGNNFWFCTKVHVSSIPHIKIKPENISRKTIQFNYMPKDESDIPEGDNIGVQLSSHFTNPIRKPHIPVTRKVYRFTYRQEQLAKHTPSELIELAYMSALLERHPFVKSEPLSKRFQVLRSFLEDIVRVVPIESILYTIASADDNLVDPCCRALIESKINLPSSACMNAGMMRTLMRIGSGENLRIETSGLFKSERNIVSGLDVLANGDYLPVVEAPDITSKRGQETMQNLKQEKIEPVSRRSQEKILRKNAISSLKNNVRDRQIESKPHGKPSVPWHFKLPSKVSLAIDQYSMLYDAQDAYSRVIAFTRSVPSTDPNYYLLSHLLQIAPPPHTSLSRAICGLNIDLLYPLTGSDIIQCPLDILIFGRKLLSKLVDQMSDQQPPTASEVNSLSQLCNTQMLHTINEIRHHHVRLCTSLLGSFMEEQMQVPLKRTSFDTAQAIFSAVSVAAMGVWALFNLSFQDVNSLLSGMPNMQLFVQVKEYIRGMFSENTINLDREYAGKLQFMVQGLDKTVSCNSHYISYSLERQLVLLCDKLNISANTSTERIVDGWDTVFKDNVLAVVAISHRPLIARWMRWALMVHNLREELAKYTAIGVVGLVNSGKSKLVNSLFGIQVAVGTTECKRTTVPFLYNLDQVVEGLDVIDFPGVDDRDETIPDLAELLLSLAQVVIFVVDYRRVHTESVKHWLEHLEKDPVHVLVCLTHADQLYVEYMNEDGTHRPSDIVRREIKIQLDMIKEKLGNCPRHSVQLYSICQGKDSVLNTPEGRKVLKEVGIGMPQDVGDWLIKVLEKHLDQQELSERLKQYIYKDTEQQQTDEATALEEH